MGCLAGNEVLITMEIKLFVQSGPFLSFDLAPPGHKIVIHISF
jgi:hypothetical protein